MKAELLNLFAFVIDDRFVTLRLSVGADVLLMECQSDEDEAISITVPGWGTIVFKLGEIESCSIIHDNKHVLFLLPKKGFSIAGSDCQVLTLFPRCQRLHVTGGRVGRERKHELDVFIDFATNHGIKLNKLNRFEEINSQIHGLKLQETEEMKDPQDENTQLAHNISLFMVEPRLETSQVMNGQKHIRFYLPYMRFLQKKNCSDRDFKTYMRSMKNLPKFFKEVLECEEAETVWVIVEYFINDHRCRNFKNCHQVTYLKCSVCKHAYYCSEQCQTMDWPKHKLHCQVIQRSNFDLDGLRSATQYFILKKINHKYGEHYLTFEVFVKEIERALFSAYFPVIEQSYFYDKVMYESLHTPYKEVWMKNLSILKRKRYKRVERNSKYLEAQMIDAFGLDGKFTQIVSSFSN